jgi:NCS1 family nucleobase:cation symporter-1
MDTVYSALTGLNAVIGLFSSLSVNMPDFGRFSKNRLVGNHQFLALPIIGTLGALTPIFVTDAHSYLWGSFEWYMPNVIAKFDSRAAKFFVSASFLLANLANQIASDTYPFSNDISGMIPKYINNFRATIFLSIFSIVCMPWNIVKNASGLLAFLGGYSCIMGPLAGTMISDYYLVKKSKLDVDQLYVDHGIYWYDGGWNWRAWVSFVVGFAPLMPGFAKKIDDAIEIGGAWKPFTFAWAFGLFLSISTHYVICTYISVPTKSLVEFAIYPPQHEDVATSILEGEDVSTKEETVTKAKEVAELV